MALKSTSGAVARRLGLACGPLAAVFLGVSVALQGALRDGYSWRRNFISELSLGDGGWAQRATFIGTGALLLIFAKALAGVAVERRPGPVHPRWSMTAVGVLLIVVGVANSETFPIQSVTVTGTIHNVAAFLCISAMVAWCFASAQPSGGGPASAQTIAVTALGVVALLGLIAISLGFPFPGKPSIEVMTENVGAVQRLTVAAFFAAVTIVAGEAAGHLRPR